MYKTILDKITPPGCVVMAYRGSIAHGMYTGGDNNSIDDIDLMGIYIETRDFYQGLDFKSLGYGGRKSDSQEYWVDKYDIVNYELRKLFALLLKGNPNVLTLLYLDPKHVLFHDPVWDKLLENKDIFLSKKAFYAFGGYAKEQLRKMFSGAHQGYMGDKRRRLVEQFGYDTKNAAHLIRLLRMGVEYLKSGHLTVNRENIDADELLAIKRGEWDVVDIEAEAQKWENELNKAFADSRLPEKPDFDTANMLCVRLIDEYYERLRGAQ